MIESWWFVLAMIAVLMIPGPTNALLASSAHQQGIAKTSMLIPAELFGYAYAISLWALLIHLSAPIWPYFIDILHILSAGYVFWMAFHLWKQSHLEQHSQKHPTIRPAQLFFSTFKNPKALLFAAGIFPVETWNNPTNVAVVYVLFSLVLLPTALFWMSFGRVILARETKKVTADLLYKGSALLLVVCMLPVVARFF
ncbi:MULTISPECIES: LysE family transporter [Acinetobacter]|jgi:threonine/homoserine/homoserine lactone efflux protein|uniref:LysE family translocator n=1 Tax=Acinetobacter TaxID=469 RepID=UPI0014448DC7|nr:MULTISPECIES: LysE family transporter [Acinetobacter]MBF4520285.1 LysE family transporter [Acinetobacter towneri]NLN58837.1 LysE family transporter [Gammaproteobacteria bacterium]